LDKSNFSLFLLEILAGHSKSLASQRHETIFTKMLLITSTLFLVLLLWQCLKQCFWLQNYGRNDENKWRMVERFYVSGKLGMVLSVSMNWIFYCLSCRAFRKELRKMLCKQQVKAGSSTY